MNWIKRIKKLLGWFWSHAFSNYDFMHALHETWGVLAKPYEARAASAEGGQLSVDGNFYSVEPPFVIYVRKSRLVTQDGEGHLEQCITGAPSTFSAIIEGGSGTFGGTGDAGDEGVYVGTLIERVDNPLFITNHVVTYSRTLFNEFDFTIKDNLIYFKMNPEDLELEQITHIEDNGVLSVYYVLYGWAYPKLAEKSHVSSFETEGLNDCADIIWDMHQNGATGMNVKRLLCAAAGNAVCEETGRCVAIWEEQGCKCFQIGSRVYVVTRPYGSCTVAVDGMVEKGAILYDSVVVLHGEADLSALSAYNDKIPSMRVAVDGGTLQAVNADNTSAVLEDSVYIIPLTGDDDSLLAAYKDKCKARVDTLHPVPSTLNPMVYILKDLRAGRALVIYVDVAAMDEKTFDRCIKCIDNNTDKSVTLVIYRGTTEIDIDKDLE